MRINTGVKILQNLITSFAFPFVFNEIIFIELIITSIIIPQSKCEEDQSKIATYDKPFFILSCVLRFADTYLSFIPSLIVPVVSP